MVRKVVSNKEFEDALHNKDNAKLINFITNKYCKLTKEVRRACGLLALWRALQTYDASFGQKFTSSLYRFVHWECRRELAKLNTQKRVMLEPKVQGESSELENTEFVEHYMKLLPANNRNFIKAYYFDNISLTDIGRSNGYTKETARKKVKESVMMLKELVKENGFDCVQ